MHRAPLLALLDAYDARWPEDHARTVQIREFVRRHADCFERTCVPGHVTGSAWIVSADHRAVLLVHHGKLDRWLQPGGHADGDPDVHRVALREAEEETGLASLTTLSDATPALPFDLDVHEIPARADEPAHLHHDVRFLLVAGPGTPRASAESRALRWVPRDRLAEVTDEESVLRLERKTRALLERA